MQKHDKNQVLRFLLLYQSNWTTYKGSKALDTQDQCFSSTFPHCLMFFLSKDREKNVDEISDKFLIANLKLTPTNQGAVQSLGAGLQTRKFWDNHKSRR